jgi:uncharacterized protein YcbK (DUF882 family)
MTGTARPAAVSPGKLRRAARLSLASALVLVAGVQGTQDVIANGDTRTLTIHHSHTKEVTTATFRRWGSYDQSELTKLNWALRDWRRDEPIKMDPRIFDVLWEVHREVGSGSPLVVVSAYRSPETNSMLRRRSRGVAKHSQHTLGKAVDFHLPDVSMGRVREIGVRLQRGGVGYYPSAYTPFVHLDVGSVRAWPRLTRDHLARLFPDGRTVHLPADGQPFAGYEIAKAEIIARGGSVGGAVGEDAGDTFIASASSSGWSFWTALFGGGGGEETTNRGGRRGILQGRQAPTQVASASVPGGDDMGSSASSRMAALGMAGAPATSEPATPAVERPIARGRGRAVPEATQVAAAPAEAEAPRTQAPVPAPTPRVTLVDAPLPVSRPRGLALPEAQPATATQTASIGTIAPGNAVLAFAPQPPARPGALDALVNARPAAAEPAPLVAAPLPPTRPEVVLAAASATATPAPLAPAPVQTPAPPVSAPLVAVRHPAPPERPQLAALASSAAPAATQPSRPVTAGAAGERSERSSLDQLFAAAAQPVAAANAKIVRARAKASADTAGAFAQGDQPAAASGFTRSNPNDVRTDRFSGPAVRSLPTTFVQN